MTDEISNLRKELYALKSSVAFEDGSNFAQFRDMVVKLNAINEKLDKKLDEIKTKINILNLRLAHIEGAYFGKELPKHVAIGED